MKTGIFLALTVASLSFPAFAQEEAVKIVPLEELGRLYPLEKMPLRLQLKVDPKLPALPKLEAKDSAKVEIRTLQTYRGPIYQLEIVRKNKADVLSSIVAAMGQRCVIEPVLSKTYHSTAVYRALSLEELLTDACGSSVETWKSSAGVYFFADKPDPEVQKMLQSLNSNKPEPTPDPNADPFIIPKGEDDKPQPKSKWKELPFKEDERL